MCHSQSISLFRPSAWRQKFIKAMIVIYSNGISVCNARANGWPKGYATRQPASQASLAKILAKKNIFPPLLLLPFLLHCEVVMAMSSIRFDWRPSQSGQFGPAVRPHKFSACVLGHGGKLCEWSAFFELKLSWNTSFKVSSCTLLVQNTLGKQLQNNLKAIYLNIKHRIVLKSLWFRLELVFCTSSNALFLPVHVCGPTSLCSPFFVIIICSTLCLISGLELWLGNFSRPCKVCVGP